MSPSGARLRLIETSPDRAVTRLHQIVRQRDVLRVDFRRTWDSIAADAADAELEAWAASALEIALVNAGPACLLAFWRVSVELRATLGVPCWRAWAAPLPTYVATRARMPHSPACRRWAPRRAVSARRASWCNGRAASCGSHARRRNRSLAVASRTETILRSCDGAAFESFIATGLKAGGH